MEQILNKILEKVTNTEDRIARLEKNVETVAIEIARMHVRVQSVEARVMFLDGIERKLDGVIRKIENMDSDNSARFSKIEKNAEKHEKLIADKKTRKKAK